jgi:flavin reductase (DIM6/NTAB) family NADH-FMN oxidoreductase RutF
MTAPDDPKRTLGKAIALIPSGVYVLSARHEESCAAMLGSWVQQAAFDPPAVSIALSRDRSIFRLIEASGLLAISVLGENDQPLMRKYARATRENGEAFEGVAITRTPGGVPALADALAWLECRVIRDLDFGADHRLLIAEVTAANIVRDHKPFIHLRKSGFHY